MGPVPFFAVFAWGLLVVAAWTGWGSLLDRLCRGGSGPRLDWGLRTGWGMAVSILAGGVLNLAHLSRTPFVVAFVLAGAVMQAGFAWRSRGGPERLPWQRWVWLAAIVAVPLLHYWAAVAWPLNYDPNDDLLAYMVFPQRMLQTGTFLDPFNLRRMAALGGHSFLQAQVQVVGSAGNFHLLDMGLCPLVLTGLVVGHLKPATHRELAEALLLTLAVLFLPVPRRNTMCALSGVVLMVTVFRTLRCQGARTGGDSRLGYALAIAVAAVATLRANFWPAPVGAVILAALGRALADREPLRGHLVRMARDLGLALLCLAPWLVLLFLSSRSFLYPFLRGNHQRNFELYSQGLGLVSTLGWLGGFFSHLPSLVLLVLPAAGALWWRRSLWRDALPFCLAALATAVVTAGAFNLAPFSDLWRYTYPLILAMFLATVLALLSLRARRSRARIGGLLLAAALLLLNLPEGLAQHRAFLARLGSPAAVAFAPDLVAVYGRAQRSVPPGRRLFTVVDHPTLLDFRRNPIYPVDVVAACSPPPGMPFFKGPEALASYLKSVSMDYVAVEDFAWAMSLYNRKVWIGHSHGDDLPIYALEARYYLDFMDNLDALQQTRRVVFNEGGIRVLEL